MLYITWTYIFVEMMSVCVTMTTVLSYNEMCLFLVYHVSLFIVISTVHF